MDLKRAPRAGVQSSFSGPRQRSCSCFVLMHRHGIFSIPLLACCILLAAGGSLARAEQERVQLILSKVPPQSSAAYKTMRTLAGEATAQTLTLTKTEVWSVPRSSVEALKRAAARRGVGIEPLPADWHDLLRPAPANMRMDSKQTALLQRAIASESTLGVSIMVLPASPVVEYALTRDTSSRAAPGDAARIDIKLNAKLSVAVTRSDVRTKSNMCVWKGRIDATGAPVTLFWWPSGKVTGIIHHGDRIYSIRHIGGGAHAIVEMRKDRMPPRHPPVTQRRRADHLPQNPSAEPTAGRQGG